MYEAPNMELGISRRVILQLSTSNKKHFYGVLEASLHIKHEL
jgi:hypothetical protein